jgi:hypothetical protein
MYRDRDNIQPEIPEQNIRAVFKEVQVLKIPREGALNYVYVATRMRKVF